MANVVRCKRPMFFGSAGNSICMRATAAMRQACGVHAAATRKLMHRQGWARGTHSEGDWQGSQGTHARVTLYIIAPALQKVFGQTLSL